MAGAQLSPSTSPSTSPARVLVAAGLIRGRLGTPQADRFLISRRKADAHLPNAWEFPGGKVEAGESPPDALIREISEELGVQIEVGDIYAIGHHVYPIKEVVLLVYEARIVAGEPVCLGVAAFEWMQPAQVAELPLPPADLPVVERLRRDLAVGPRA
jgi:8-oxo-dGTP diphosphatase